MSQVWNNSSCDFTACTPAASITYSYHSGYRNWVRRLSPVHTIRKGGAKAPPFSVFCLISRSSASAGPRKPCRGEPRLVTVFRLCIADTIRRVYMELGFLLAPHFAHGFYLVCKLSNPAFISISQRLNTGPQWSQFDFTGLTAFNELCQRPNRYLAASQLD